MRRLFSILGVALALAVGGCGESENVKITFSSAPEQNSRASEVLFRFFIEGDLTFECSLSGADFASCVSPLLFNTLKNGSYELVIRALDANRAEVARESFQFTIDRAVPTVTFSKSPGAYSPASFSFEFGPSSGNASDFSFSCAFDSAAFSACSSPLNLSAMTAGAHNLKVRLKDALGNESSSVELNWEADLVNPTIEFDPSGSSVSSTPTGTSSTCNKAGKGKVLLISRVSDTGGSGLKSAVCRIGGVIVGDCNNSKGLTYFQTEYVSFGVSHSYVIDAEDNAGNTSSYTHSFMVTDDGTTCFDPDA